MEELEKRGEEINEVETNSSKKHQKQYVDIRFGRKRRNHLMFTPARDILLETP
jgi:hypothetical protein